MKLPQASNAFAFAYEDLGMQLIVVVGNDYLLIANCPHNLNLKLSIGYFQNEFQKFEFYLIKNYYPAFQCPLKNAYAIVFVFQKFTKFIIIVTSLLLFL